MTQLYDYNGDEIAKPEVKSDSEISFGMVLVLVFVAAFGAFFFGRSTVPTPVVPDATKIVDAQHSWMVPPLYEAPKDAHFDSIDTSQGPWSIYYTTTEKLESLGCEAYTSMSTHTIYLPTDAPLPARRHYLLHEVMHVAEFIGGGPDQRLASIGPEEEVINSGAPQLLDILRRNPRLVEWLRAGADSGEREEPNGDKNK